MTNTNSIVIAAAAGMLACALSFGAVTSARAEGCGDEAAGKQQGKSHVEIINGKRVYVIDTVVSVCGKVPRPSVVYVLTAKNINYEWENLKQDFMPLILASVKRAPF